MQLWQAQLRRDLELRVSSGHRVGIIESKDEFVACGECSSQRDNTITFLAVRINLFSLILYSLRPST